MLLIIWLLVVTIFFVIFINTIINIKNENFPEKYTLIKSSLGSPLTSFYVNLFNINGFRIRGFYGKLYIYNQLLILKFFDRCIIISDFNDIKIEKQLLGNYLTLQYNEKYIKGTISNKQANKILKYFNGTKDETTK